MDNIDARNPNAITATTPLGAGKGGDRAGLIDPHDADLARTRAERGDLIAEAINECWGPRCPEGQPGCPVCDAWAQYDALREKAPAPEAL